MMMMRSEVGEVGKYVTKREKVKKSSSQFWLGAWAGLHSLHKYLRIDIPSSLQRSSGRMGAYDDQTVTSTTSPFL
jgi:hypothetical protein